jgi:hypothetical protein
LERWDIRPVETTTLAAHKQAQLRQFGPSFWYRHQTSLGLTLLVSVGCMAASAGAANSILGSSSPVVLTIAMGWLVLMAGLIVSGVFHARPGSTWEERWLPVDRLEAEGVPPSIAARARSLHQDIPGSTVVLGELIQGSDVVDPYLLLVRDDDRVCLGVWDEGGIIAQAK